MSLRARLLLSYALVIAVCLSLVIFVFGVVARGYSERVAVERLGELSLPIFVQARTLASAQTAVRDVWADLQVQAQESNVGILLLSGDGKVLRTATPWRTLGIEQLVVPPHVLTATTPTDGTWRAPSGQVFVYIAYPLTVVSLGSGQESAVLVLATPRRGVLATWGILLLPLLWSGLAAFVLSVILAVLIARSFYRPIQALTAAAGRMAEGEYGQQVPATGPPELKRLATAFNSLAAQVKLSHQRLRDFVADVSHELKSPLTSINGFAQALLDGTAADDASRQRAAEIIRDESRRVAVQVDELLLLSRMQAGQLRFARDRVALADVVRWCVELLSPAAQEKGSVLELSVDETVQVVGDADRLEQVVANLLDNALKHSPRGGAIGLSVQHEAAGLIAIRVSDSGPGIAPDMLEHVFERFYQGTGVRTGAGLGLAIAREIVLAHGGTISAANGPSGGAMFTVRLPAAPPAA
jgi:two-component system, OmpR family, sensor kinase